MDKTRTLELDGIEVEVHAAWSDCDGKGNPIAETYAKTWDVQELSDGAQTIRRNVNALQESVKTQNVSIDKAATDASDAKRKSLSNEADVKQIGDIQNAQQQSIADFKASIRSQMATLQEEINKPCKCGKDKGTYLTFAELKKNESAPVAGDTAFVLAPNSIGSGTFDPTEYFGEDYLGYKDDNYSVWHISTAIATGKYFRVNDLYFIVNANVTYQLLADQTAQSLADHGHITQIEVKNYSAISEVPYYMYVCRTDGSWVNTGSYRTFDVSETILASKVIDSDDLTQDDVNIANRVNAMTINANNFDIAQIVNRLAAKVNEMQLNGVFSGAMTYERIPLLALADVSTSSADNHTKFGHTFPFVFTAEETTSN